jgi:hypothetical protein
LENQEEMLGEVDGLCRYAGAQTAETESKLLFEPLEVLCGGHVCHLIFPAYYVWFNM